MSKDTKDLAIDLMDKKMAQNCSLIWFSGL
jgi:hypothetical protein